MSPLNLLGNQQLQCMVRMPCMCILSLNSAIA